MAVSLSVLFVVSLLKLIIAFKSMKPTEAYLIVRKNVAMLSPYTTIRSLVLVTLCLSLGPVLGARDASEDYARQVQRNIAWMIPEGYTASNTRTCFRTKCLNSVTVTKSEGGIQKKCHFYIWDSDIDRMLSNKFMFFMKRFVKMPFEPISCYINLQSDLFC